MSDEIIVNKRLVYLSWIAGLPCLVYEDGTLLEVDDLEANKYLLQQAFQVMWSKE